MTETAAKTYDLTKVHEANRKLLKEIDRICRKYKINYMMDSGTLFGSGTSSGLYSMGRRRGCGIYKTEL